MVQIAHSPTFIPFDQRLERPLTKAPITVLQINLGRRCNLACTHCHVEAGPSRTEELSPAVCEQLIAVINRFDELQTVDLTGGAPEMNYGFRPLVEAARSRGKTVIVRSNLTIFFEPGFTDLPTYFAEQKVRVVASLPCYLEKNVDKQRGAGVYQRSIEAIKLLNAVGYGRDRDLILDLVYNPSVPLEDDFSLAPGQMGLERDYKAYLSEHFGIDFNQLLVIMNLPIGRTGQVLQRRGLETQYLQFLAENYNPQTVEHVMCRKELSVDYLGRIYDCDFNQMAGVPAQDAAGNPLTIQDFLERDRLDLIPQIQTRDYCYGCTAGSGSSCGGSLLS